MEPQTRIGSYNLPLQGINIGKLVNFNVKKDNTNRTLEGRIVRDDITEPHITIIEYDNSGLKAYFLDSEVRYTILSNQ